MSNSLSITASSAVLQFLHAEETFGFLPNRVHDQWSADMLIYRTLQQPHLVSILSDRLKIQDPELIRCPIEYEYLSAENND